MTEKLLTVEDAARLLQIHPRTLRIWLRQGRIKARRYGRLWRILESDLEAFIRGGTPPAAAKERL
jgi:excisionase family DNA binding protein